MIEDLRMAICQRCRWPERRAAGAATEVELREAAQEASSVHGVPMHIRISQCLNCCDGGHTVRLEFRGHEVAVCGVRTPEDIASVAAGAQGLVGGECVEPWSRRIYQRWDAGRLVYHRRLSEDDPARSDS